MIVSLPDGRRRHEKSALGGAERKGVREMRLTYENREPEEATRALGFDWTRFYVEDEKAEGEDKKTALESGETTINAVRQQYGLSAIKGGSADQRLKKLN